MLRSVRARLFLPLLVGMGCAVFPAYRAHAVPTVSVDATVLAQGYDLRTVDLNPQVVARRRLTSYLGLRLDGMSLGAGLDPVSQRGPFSLVFELRIEADFGDFLCSIGRTGFAAPLGCLSESRGGVRTEPELQNHRAELLLAYAEGVRLGGRFDLRLGRQLSWELFDLRGFDGLFLATHLPFGIVLDVYGGLSESPATSLNPSSLTLDGTSRSPGSQPLPFARSFEAPQPLLGVTARLDGFSGLQARIAYRKTWFVPPALTAPCEPPGPCPPGFGTLEDRLAASLHASLLSGRIHVFSGVRYDLLSRRFDHAQATLTAALTPRQRLSLDYQLRQATFAGDSIWNVFASDPSQWVSLRADAVLSRPQARTTLSLFGAAFFQQFAIAGTSSAPPVFGDAEALGGDLGLRLSRRHSHAELRGVFDTGYGGTRALASLSGRLMLLADRLTLEARLLYTYASQPERPRSVGHGGVVQLGARCALFSGLLAHILVEDSIDRQDLSQLRLLASLDLSALLGPDVARYAGRRGPLGLLAAGHGAAPSPGLAPGLFW